MSESTNEFRGGYRFLSNFYLCPIVFEGDLYASVEHAFQAAKTLDPAERKTVRLCVKPGDAKRAGRKVKKRDDWDDIRVSVMRELLYQKFNSSPLRQRLLNTGIAELIEGNDWGDVFWGVCRGRGENWLGKLLMEVRALAATQATAGGGSE
jgi:ribA/ribD-fused uncharacterized protein